MSPQSTRRVTRLVLAGRVLRRLADWLDPHGAPPPATAAARFPRAVNTVLQPVTREQLEAKLGEWAPRSVASPSSWYPPLPPWSVARRWPGYL